MKKGTSKRNWTTVFSLPHRPRGSSADNSALSKQKRNTPYHATSRRWLWLLALPILWEIIRFLLQPNPLLMPSSADIFLAVWHGITTGELPIRWLLSLAVVSAGLLFGAAAALALALLSRSNRTAASILSVISSLMHPLPGLALMPLVILWFGTGTNAVLFIIVHAVLWPIFVNLESGMRSLAPAWTLYARNLALSGWKTFVKISLPGAFPHLISGLRIGWARAWRAFIAAEMVFGAVGSMGGLGWQLFESRVMMDSPALYAALIAVMLTGMAMEDFLLGRWENRVRKKWGEIAP